MQFASEPRVELPLQAIETGAFQACVAELARPPSCISTHLALQTQHRSAGPPPYLLAECDGHVLFLTCACMGRHPHVLRLIEVCRISPCK